MYTYKKLKDEVFKLLFNYSNKGVLTLNNGSNKDAMLALPEAVNFAFLDIAQVKPLVKQYYIIKSVPPLCVSQENAKEAFKTYTHSKADIIREFDNVSAYYLEVLGNAVVKIYADGVLVDTIKNTDNSKYTAYKKHIQAKKLQICFTGNSFYHFKNVMCYDVNFYEDNYIMPFGAYCFYDLKTILTRADGTSGFLRLNKQQPITYANGEKYKANPNFYLQGTEIVMLNYFDEGEFVVQYDYNPMHIEENTPDDFDLSTQLPMEALGIIPYLIAYRVGLDDEEEKATMYFNLYEQKKAELKSVVEVFGHEYFTSESGF